MYGLCALSPISRVVIMYLNKVDLFQSSNTSIIIDLLWRICCRYHAGCLSNFGNRVRITLCSNDPLLLKSYRSGILPRTRVVGIGIRFCGNDGDSKLTNNFVHYFLPFFNFFEWCLFFTTSLPFLLMLNLYFIFDLGTRYYFSFCSLEYRSNFVV